MVHNPISRTMMTKWILLIANPVRITGRRVPDSSHVEVRD
jgi:hypothetical protein